VSLISVLGETELKYGQVTNDIHADVEAQNLIIDEAVGFPSFISILDRLKNWGFFI